MAQIALRVGEVAARAGVHRESLRYYERRGLIPPPPRRISGYRAYPAETVERVRPIKWAQGLGFTLREIVELSRIPRDHVRGRTQHVRSRAVAKIDEIDKKIPVLSHSPSACVQPGRSGRSALHHLGSPIRPCDHSPCWTPSL